MYKLIALFGPYLVKLFAVGGGLCLFYYLILRLRLRPYVLLLCSLLLYVPLVKKLSIGLGAGLNPTTLMILALGLLWLGQERKQPIKSPLKLLLFFWILINTLSFLMTSSVEGGVYFDFYVRELKRLIDPILLFYFTLSVREDNEVRGVVVSICAGTLMVGFHAYAQGITQSGRIEGLLEHPNLTMAFLSAYAPFVLALAFGAKTWMSKIALFAVFFIVIMGMFETGSRMGIVATAAGCFAVLLISGNRWVSLLGIFGAVLLVLSPQLMPEGIYKRFQGILGEEPAPRHELSLDESVEDDSVGSRVAIWKGGLRIARRHPLTGTGFGTFKREIAPYMIDFYGWDREKSAHNAFIQTAAETGILGFLVLVLIFRSALKQSRLAFTNHPDLQSKWIGRGAFGTTLALLLSNMTSASYQDTEVMAYFFALSGLIAVLGNQALEPLPQQANSE